MRLSLAQGRPGHDLVEERRGELVANAGIDLPGRTIRIDNPASARVRGGELQKARTEPLLETNPLLLEPILFGRGSGKTGHAPCQGPARRYVENIGAIRVEADHLLMKIVHLLTQPRGGQPLVNPGAVHKAVG